MSNPRNIHQPDGWLLGQVFELASQMAHDSRHDLFRGGVCSIHEDGGVTCRMVASPAKYESTGYIQ